MIPNDPTNVMAAFEILVEEIEAEVQFIQRVGSRALESGDYKKAREALDRVQEVTAFREKAAALRSEWERMVATENEEDVPEGREERRNPGRLRRGLRTPEKAYFRPILESLRDLGGSAQMGQAWTWS